MTKVKFLVEDFPADTEEIFLIGSIPELGNWNIENAIKMQYYQNDGTNEQFYVYVNIPFDTYVEYKFVNHKSWNCVECGYVSEDIPNRTFTTKETKTRTITNKIKGFRL